MTAPTTRETADHAELAARKPEDHRVRAVMLACESRMKGYETPIHAADAKFALDYLLSEIAALRGERDRLRNAASKSNEEVCQSLGKALGYPWFKDDQANFPGSTETDGVCVGDHVAESIADEASRRLTQAERQRDEAVGLLKRWRLTRGEMSGAGTVETATSAFLANQGADQ